MIDISLLQKSFPSLLSGLKNTLVISVAGCLIGITGGTFLGVLQYTGRPAIQYFIGTIVGILRGTPMLLQIILTRYALPYFGIHISLLSTAIVAIGVNSCAYISQIVRSGVAAISVGQWEAAQVLGLTRWQALRYVVLPQAFSKIIPVLGNEFITLVKESSLASYIGVMELSKQANQIASRTYDFMTPLIGAAILYLLLTTILGALFSYLEKRFHSHA